MKPQQPPGKRKTMKIKFFKIEDFREECLGRNIHRIRRDYVTEGAAVESGNKDMGKVSITRFKMVLTATDGEDLLYLEHLFYRCFTALATQEETKENVKHLVEQIETQLHKDFPEGYPYTQDGKELTRKFWLDKGIIEEV